MDFRKKILEELKENLRITGNKVILELFETYSDNEKELYKALKEYNSGLYISVHEDMEEDEELDSSENKPFFHYIYLADTLIDFRNLSRVELYEEYNQKKNKIEYGINFIKKFPSVNEENFIIFFSSEEERDRDFDVLRGKFKMCNINIM